MRDCRASALPSDAGPTAYTAALPADLPRRAPRDMAEHKNRSRAPLRPLDLPTLALTVGGLGFLRPAPGTWGSIPPPLLAAVLAAVGVTSTANLTVLASVFALACLACVVWGRYAETRFGRKDAAEVVADETAGVALPVVLAILAVDRSASTATTLLALWPMAAAFVLFRVTDIIKPWSNSR